MKVHIDEIAKVGVAAKGVPSCELSSYTSFLDNVLLSNFLPLLLSLPDMSTTSAVDIEAISFPVRFLSLFLPDPSISWLSREHGGLALMGIKVPDNWYIAI